jgi:hypothetical protein
MRIAISESRCGGHAAMEREAAMNIATGKLFSAPPINDCLRAGHLMRRPPHTFADDDGHIPHHAVREKRTDEEAAAEKFLIDEQRRTRLAVNPTGVRLARISIRKR